MSLIKICGLSRPLDIEAVNEAMPDYIGFVFAESRRQVKPPIAAELRKSLDRRIQAVGVFVNAPIDTISSLCQAGTIDIIQLHGDEGDEYARSLGRVVNNPIIRAVRVCSEEDIRRAGDLEADFLLLDAFDSRQYGGAGKAFDWALLDGFDRPYFLAGGLTVENIPEALKLDPYAVDISSGVETDGVKDKKKILAAVRQVRS